VIRKYFEVFVLRVPLLYSFCLPFDDVARTGGHPFVGHRCVLSGDQADHSDVPHETRSYMMVTVKMTLEDGEVYDKHMALRAQILMSRQLARGRPVWEGEVRSCPGV
jgi:hypothetical protein